MSTATVLPTPAKPRITLGIGAALVFVILPTGHWRGLDRGLHAKYPNVIFFK